jgi:nicotinamide-nucleotide amidase
MANAEIIAVGSELLTPGKIDTNSLFLTGELNTLGVEVVKKSIVGDDRALLTKAILDALRETQIVILSGGLGPTEDDLTRDAVAAATDRQLIFNQGVCDGIAERFRRFNRQMAEINKRQAYILEGAEILENARGTAPGQWLEHNGALVMLLPGPPNELKPLFMGECVPRLTRALPPMAIRTRFLRVAGLGESDLDALIAPVYTRYQNPVTTILTSPGEVHVHLRSRCGSPEEAEKLLEELEEKISALLGSRIFSRNGDELETVVGKLLRERSATLSVAESCTGGLLGERITRVPGSSDYFRGGFLTYTDAMKTWLLGVPAELIAEHTSVSEAVAIAMAERARHLTDSTYALSVTGYAGPEGDPPGLVFIGLATPASFLARRFQFPGDRTRVRTFAAQWALDLLRKEFL